MVYGMYIALSFDIEDWYHTASITGSSISKYRDIDEFHHKNKNVADCITEETIRILELLDEFKIKATIFIVVDVAIRYPEITEALKKSKHEIASHSLTHKSAIDAKTKQALQSKEDWLEDQVKAKEVLEDIFQREVVGYRAPNAYFANWMVPLLSKIGFKYDSSIAHNSFYNKTNVKLKNIPSKPYRINSITLNNYNPDSDLVELPWSNFKITDSLILPAGGAYFFRLFGYRYFKNAINKALKYGDTMFYLHPLDISNKKIPLSNLKHRPLFWINKGLPTEKNLIRLLNTYKEILRPCRDIYERFVNEG